MVMPRGPTVIHVAPSRSAGAGCDNGQGVPCCCFFRCCVCFNFGVLKTPHGLMKLVQSVLGGVCILIVKEGMATAGSSNTGWLDLLITASACQLTIMLLLISFLLSSTSEQLIRQSIFECLFNGVASFMYLSASLFKFTSSYFFDYVKFSIFGYTSAPEYPYKNIVFYIALVLGLLHGIDCYMSYKFKGCRG